jgi:hypothetical protein
MTKQTRYFIIGSALVLVLGLSVGLVAYYGGFPGFAAQATNVPELQYVPSDAAVVAYVNVHDVMDSQFRRKMQTFEPSGSEKGQQEFRDQTGINIETDIDFVLAYMAPGTGGRHLGAILAHGQFQPDKIKGLLEQHGARTETYRGTTLYEPGETAKEAPGALAFLGPNLVAVGSVDAVKRMVDVHAGGGTGNVMANPELIKLIQSVQGNSNAWAVGRFDALTGEAKLPAQVASQIPAVTYFTASGHVNGGVAGNLSMEAKDGAAAENLRKVIDGFIALGQLQLGATAGGGVQDIIKSLNLQTTTSGTTVAVSFSVSPELLDSLKQLQGVKRAPGAPEPPAPPAPPVPPAVKQ